MRENHFQDFSVGYNREVSGRSPLLNALEKIQGASHNKHHFRSILLPFLEIKRQSYSFRNQTEPPGLPVGISWVLFVKAGQS